MARNVLGFFGGTPGSGRCSAWIVADTEVFFQVVTFQVVTGELPAGCDPIERARDGAIMGCFLRTRQTGVSWRTLWKVSGDRPCKVPSGASPVTPGGVGCDRGECGGTGHDDTGAKIAGHAAFRGDCVCHGILPSAYFFPDDRRSIRDHPWQAAFQDSSTSGRAASDDSLN